MESAQIARRFVDYFSERGHAFVPSASMVPADPASPLVNAGMVPLRPYFLGHLTPPSARAVSAQDCVSDAAIGKVGKTARHATFFEMLGNFSFGDYAQEQAIELAWELLTRPEADGGFGLDSGRLWASVYSEDDEALRVWRDRVGLPAHRIRQRGLAGNYWHMRVPGPGGPCSRIYYDRGPRYGRDGGPGADQDRYLQVWNLVFMRQEVGAIRSADDFDVVGDLPARGIGTGMGLERMAVLLQGADTIYEIDTAGQVLGRAAELTEQKYGRDRRCDVGLRVVADHARAAVMLAADGVVPADEGHGYVLRRVVRRCVRELWLLAGAQRGGDGGRGGQDSRLLHEVTSAAVGALGDQHPRLAGLASAIHAVLDAEAAEFGERLRRGTAIFDVAVEDAVRHRTQAISGPQALALHDTYGFPVDLTIEMAAEQGLAVDEAEFRRLMAERQPAGGDAAPALAGDADASVFARILEQAGRVVFTGYDEVESTGAVIGVLAGGVSVPAAGAGAEVDVVLDRTPCYPEGGGQLADVGVMRTERSGAGDAATVDILDVQAPVPGLIVHRCRVRAGEITVGDVAHVEVDVERRRAISRSHTATHLVHRAFRGALGESAAQAGAANYPGRLRFDFTAAGAVPAQVLAEVEDEVNDVLMRDLDVRAFYTSIGEARALGALALFGEKYGEQVRVVEVGSYSRELCGGTHVARSGQLGLVKILGEASIGSGIRRVDALVGIDAFRFLARESLLVSRLAEQLKAPRADLADRIAALVTRLRDAERDLRRAQEARLADDAASLAGEAADVNGVAYVTHRVPDGTPADTIRNLALDVCGRLPADHAAVVVTAGVPADRPAVVVAVNDAARARGIAAGALIGTATGVLGGRGGGRDDIAQGGGAALGDNAGQALADAFEAVRVVIDGISR